MITWVFGASPGQPPHTAVWIELVELMCPTKTLCQPFEHNPTHPQTKAHFLHAHHLSHRANLIAIARQRHCEAITQEVACWADRERRCYWHTSKTGKSDCRSADMLEVRVSQHRGFKQMS